MMDQVCSLRGWGGCEGHKAMDGAPTPVKELPGHVQVSHLRLLPLKCGAVSSARWGGSGCEQGPQGSEWVEKRQWRGS